METLTREKLIVENAQAQKDLAASKARIQHLEAENRWLKEHYKLAQLRKFGSSSENTPAGLQGELLFNEAELVLDCAAEVIEPQAISYPRKPKSVGHRQEVLANIPTEIREYRLAQEEQLCCACGGAMHEMSSQCRDELVIIPAQVKVIKHVRYVYGCRHCDRNEISVPIVTAPGSAPLFPKSLASASAVAYIMSQKFVESMPLYRIEKHFERFGIELSRAVMSNWTLKGGEMLEPIYDRIRESLLELSVLHADETTLQVLKESGRSAQNKSYMWLYRSGRDGPPIVCYEYQPTRDGDHARRFLTGVAGYVHVDGYAGYNDIADVRLVGCWAHARRKFMEAVKVLPKEHRNDPQNLANIGLKHINKLFEIERDLRDFSSDERKAARLERSKPIVNLFKIWLDATESQTLPQSILGKAIGYCRNQWPKLIVFLEDGRLELHNNRAERSIKPFVIGRKNWLFANTPRGAKTSAVIYSIVETAKENGLNPSAYLQYLFERLPEIATTDADAIDSLLPWNETVQSALQAQKSLPLKDATSA